jgi:hypothetical protein
MEMKETRGTSSVVPPQNIHCSEVHTEEMKVELESNFL